jgi:putative exporter of polyketide antibiotics
MKPFGEDSRGVSTVVGSVLMVGVAIVIATTVAVFVFGVDLGGLFDQVAEFLDGDQNF